MRRSSRIAAKSSKWRFHFRVLGAEKKRGIVPYGSAYWSRIEIVITIKRRRISETFTPRTSEAV